MQNLVWIAAAGALGTLSRYGLGLLVRSIYPGYFPLGTFVINMLGCLLFGFVWAMTEGRAGLPPEVRLIVLVGFMGAFTTFSSFIFETGNLMQDSRWMMVLLNLIGQNVLGLLCLFAGITIGRLL